MSEFRLCNARLDVIALANKLDSFPSLGLDTESSGPLLVHLTGKDEMLNLYRSSLTGLSIALPDGISYYVPISHRRHNTDLESLSRLYAALAGYKGVIWIHNARWELGAFRYGPLPSPLQPSHRIGCTQVGTWLVQKGTMEGGAKGFGLKDLTKKHFGMEQLTFEEATGGKDFSELDPRDAVTLRYACEDAVGALRLGEEVVLPGLRKHGLEDLFWGTEMDVVRCFRHMEDTGWLLDPESLETTTREFEAEIAQLEEEWDWLLPKRIKLTSSKALQWFYQEGHWDPEGVEVKAHGPSTEKEYISWQLHRCKPGSLGHEAARIKVRHSALTKLVSTYGYSLLEKAWQYPDMRLHGNMNPTGTATGRPSSSYPNMLNIPARSKEGKRIREAFISRPGWTLVSADYSQIELRILAHFLGKGRLFDAIASGGDPHQATADAARVTRDIGKTLNFAVIYGVGEESLGRKTGIGTAAAKRALENLKQGEPGIESLRLRVIALTEQRGYVKTLSGRFRRLPGIRAKAWGAKGHAERAAFNTPFQGGARDIMTQGMLSFFRQMDHTRCRLVSQIYDDLITEMEDSYVEEGQALLQQCLESAWKLAVPLVAEPATGKRWSEHK